MEPKRVEEATLAEAVERILFEQGWEEVEGFEDWDGDDVDALREILTPEQYETLLDELQQGRDR